MQFYPHKGDLDTEDKQVKRTAYLKELNEMHQHKLSPIELDQKRDFIIQSDRAIQVSMYYTTWVKNLDVPGLRQWLKLMRNHMEHRPPKYSRWEWLLSMENHSCSVESAKVGPIFFKAWDQVFGAEKTAHGVYLAKIDLLDVIRTYTKLQNKLKPTKFGAIDSDLSQQGFEALESQLETYVSLGCLICFKHSCEHGFFTDDNSRERFALESGRLARRLAKYPRSRRISDNVCARKCWKNNQFVYVDPVRTWRYAEHKVLRAIYMSTAACLQDIDPICHAAVLLNRDCCDVHRKFENLGIAIPAQEPMFSYENEYNAPPRGFTRGDKPLSKYKLTKLTRDEEAQKVNWDHIHRPIDNVNGLRGCDHDGPCHPENENCYCATNGFLCEKYCGCSKSCPNKFQGCDCKVKDNICCSQTTYSTCICMQLNRECDPDLCGSCGIVERANPANVGDQNLSLTGCQNWSLQSGVEKRLVLGESQYGFGLFAAEDIKKNEFIIEYVGELVFGDEGERRYIRRQNLFERQESSSYNFTILEGCQVWVDAARYGNLSRFVNHEVKSKPACNVLTKICLVNGAFRVEFRAKKNIKAWEELLFDYGSTFAIGKQSSENGQSRKVARKTAPAGKNSDRSVEEIPETADSDREGDESSQETLSQKRKRVIKEGSEEDFYELTGSKASESSSFTSGRLRTRPHNTHQTKTAASENTASESGEPPQKRARSRPQEYHTTSFSRSVFSKPPPIRGEDLEQAVAPRCTRHVERQRVSIVISDSEDEVENIKIQNANEEGLKKEEDIQEQEDDAEQDGVTGEDDNEDDGEEKEKECSATPRREPSSRNRRQPARFDGEVIYGYKKRHRRKRVNGELV